MLSGRLDGSWPPTLTALYLHRNGDPDRLGEDVCRQTYRHARVGLRLCFLNLFMAVVGLVLRLSVGSPGKQSCYSTAESAGKCKRSGGFIPSDWGISGHSALPRFRTFSMAEVSLAQRYLKFSFTVGSVRFQY